MLPSGSGRHSIAQVWLPSQGQSLWDRLLGRPVSESGRLRHGEGNRKSGARRRRVLELPTLRPIEALDEGVLIGLAGLNVAKTDRLSRTSLDEGLGDAVSLGVVIGPPVSSCRMGAG